jgi:hypothetical protein
MLRSPLTRVFSPLYVSGTLRPCLSITMIAAWADVGATGPRIERVVGPFDFTVLGHRTMLL